MRFGAAASHQSLWRRVAACNGAELSVHASASVGRDRSASTLRTLSLRRSAMDCAQWEHVKSFLRAFSVPIDDECGQVTYAAP